MTTPQGPRQPLDEKDAEIERLRMQLAAVRGSVIGWSLGIKSSEDALNQIARDLRIESRTVVDAKGENDE